MHIINNTNNGVHTINDTNSIEPRRFSITSNDVQEYPLTITKVKKDLNRIAEVPKPPSKLFKNNIAILRAIPH